MADLLGAVESNIVHAKENEALDFRNMQMAQCSMTGVAAALVAQVANSTLQLQYMPTIHWTIPALCTCSLILGLLSLSYVLQLHYSLANLTSAVDLRKAFTWRAPDGTDGSNEGAEARSGDGGRGGGGERGEGAGVGTPGQLEAGTGVGTLGQVGAGTGAGTLGQVGAGSDPERASYEATFILWLPFALFRIAIYLYLAAILSYWGVAAKMDLQESRARSTNVGYLSFTTSFVFQADHEFLGICIFLDSIVGGCIRIVLAKWRIRSRD